MTKEKLQIIEEMMSKYGLSSEECNDYIVPDLIAEVKRQRDVIEKLRVALEKIANKETSNDKYNSYEQGWEGVADFAREALKETSE